MNPTVEKLKTGEAQMTAPLSRALGQSERVQDKVEQAATDLASVNAVLKDEIAVGMPLAKVDQVLDQSEAVEVKVQEASDELVAVNDALAEEIVERHLLEERLTLSDAALVESRSDAEESRHRSLHDPVTGLPNLTLFNDRLRNALAQAQRHGWRLAVMFIDLDGFKTVNDTHGHDIGDQVLQQIGQRLLAAVRGGDTVSRRSGDEFLLLMLEAKDEPNVAAFAARIAANIAESCDVAAASLSVKGSIGMALYPEDGASVDELLKHADIAMYAAKERQAGPVFYSSIASR
jgi:diguanylate cyclase (GGDEF)-like protein